MTSRLDYEAELGVVIGKAGRGIKKADAMDYVFGYTVINDFTARDLQKLHRQWFIGKSLDGFCPMGPYLVTADEVDGQEPRLEVLGQRRAAPGLEHEQADF
ncbi:2-keto-4-pentenoate hydratase/2-oxohepta-3-ene-1,7-dioic acid hydratase in catechol pathway [Paraburkholderia sp. MM5482-R2]